MICTVIPVIIPVDGVGDEFRQMIFEIKSRLDQISLYVGFDVTIILKIIGCVIVGHLIAKLVKIMVGNTDLF